MSHVDDQAIRTATIHAMAAHHGLSFVRGIDGWCLIRPPDPSRKDPGFRLVLPNQDTAHGVLLGLRWCDDLLGNLAKCTASGDGGATKGTTP